MSLDLGKASETLIEWRKLHADLAEARAEVDRLKEIYCQRCGWSSLFKYHGAGLAAELHQRKTERDEARAQVAQLREALALWEPESQALRSIRHTALAATEPKP